MTGDAPRGTGWYKDFEWTPDELDLVAVFLSEIRRAPKHGRIEVKCIAVLNDGTLAPESRVEPAVVRPLERNNLLTKAGKKA